MKREQAVKALEKVIDPELGIDIVTLGFIRNLETDPSGSVSLIMTLTSPLCPLKGEIVGEVKRALRRAGATDVNVEMEFEPPWQPPPQAKALLGL